MNDHVHPAFHEALALATKPVTRFDWQKMIEDAITAFNGDAVEAMELLDALTGALKDRYDEGQLSDVLHEARQLRDALAELDATSLADANEEEMRSWMADMDYGNEERKAE